jgi:spoIIIJ-associated protein
VAAPETARAEEAPAAAAAPAPAAPDPIVAAAAPPERVAAPEEPRAEPAAPPAPARSLAPADPAEATRVAGEVTLQMLSLMGFDEATVEPSDALLPSEVEDSAAAVLCIRGRGTDRLLAHEAEGLNALQFLVRLVVSRRLDGWVSVLLDVDGDRARRVQELLQLASQSADLVQREGRAVALPPMSAYERRVVHLALRDHPAVATQSIGTGDYRKVTVRLKDQLLPQR